MKYLNIVTILFAMFLLLPSCSNVKILSKERKEQILKDAEKSYTETFKTRMQPIKDQFRQGKMDQAQKNILAWKDDELKPVEIATKKNLLGVIYFAKKNYDEAIKTFEAAYPLSIDDPNLTAQIQLNLGSSYFKQNKNEKAFEILSNCEFRFLPDNEAKKYHQLHAILAQQLGKKEVTTSSLLRAVADIKTLPDLKSNSKFLTAEENFNKLTRTERIRTIEDFQGEKSLAVAYLALKETERSLNSGNESEYKDSYNWLTEHFGEFPEILDQLQPIKARVENGDEKIEARHIGIVLPLSGERSALGERALSGLDIALEELNTLSESNPNLKYKLEIKDSASESANGTFAVKELIETGKVSLVIGGMNPQSATKEYLEAKKHGVPFISLSQVYLPKEEKDHMLIEIPGSVESQVNHIFNSNLATKLGSRGALLYPKNELGEAYANEFWRKAKSINYPITSVASFDKNSSDFKDPVMNLIGIKYPREREEEFQLVADISTMEKNKNIKRLQNLQPQLDFDWLFAPALPRDVLQLLPNFNFFDAFNTNFIGVPSWRSEIMTNEGYRFGNVYFIDEPMTQNESKFTQGFLNKNKKMPKFVETLGYDALKLAGAVIDSQSTIGTREELDRAMMKVQNLKGESGAWVLSEGVWIKQMTTYRIRREGIEQSY